MAVKAYSYVRFSTPEQAKGDSLRRQTAEVAREAERLGLELDTSLTLHDLGVSAFDAKNVRQGALGAFLRAIDAGYVQPGSYLFVENLDRVSRADPWDALPVFQQIINAGVTIYTLQDHRAWSREAMRDNPFRIFESLLVMIRAHEESATKAARLAEAWKHKRAKAGDRPLTSIAPAWLRLDRISGKWEVIEERAAVVRRIFTDAAQGAGQHTIAQQLNAESVPPFGRAAHWHRSYVSKIVNNPAVVGTFTPHRMELVDGRKIRRPLDPIENYFPAIIARELFDRVAGMLHGKAPRGRHSGKAVQNILAGLARCPKCGGTMTRVNKGSRGGRPYLVCAIAKAGAGCEYHAVRYPPIEEALLRDASWLTAETPGDDALEAELAGVEESLDSVRRGLRRVLDAIQAGGETPSLRERLAELESNLRELEAEYHRLLEKREDMRGPLVEKRLEELREALEVEPLDRTKANTALRSAVDHAEIDYDTGAVRVMWKHGGESKFVFGMPPVEARAID